jgi:hypothetical protein
MPPHPIDTPEPIWMFNLDPLETAMSLQDHLSPHAKRMKDPQYKYKLLLSIQEEHQDNEESDEEEDILYFLKKPKKVMPSTINHKRVQMSSKINQSISRLQIENTHQTGGHFESQKGLSQKIKDIYEIRRAGDPNWLRRYFDECQWETGQCFITLD